MEVCVYQATPREIIARQPVWPGGALVPDVAAVRKTLLIAAIAIIVLGCLREWLRLGYGIEGTSFFSLNREQNIGAWFSTTMLAGCALLLLLCGRAAAMMHERYHAFWYLLSFTFLALSIDEASSVHESLMVPIQTALRTDGVFRYAWVIPALVLVPLFALTSVPFLLRLPRKTALAFVGAGGLYVTGALGFEMIEGLTDGAGVVFVLCYIIEETLEIAGILWFFLALWRHLSWTAEHELMR